MARHFDYCPSTRWLWPGNSIFAEVASMVVTWRIVAFCAVYRYIQKKRMKTEEAVIWDTEMMINDDTLIQVTTLTERRPPWTHIARIPDSESQYGDADHPLYHCRAILKISSKSTHKLLSIIKMIITSKLLATASCLKIPKLLPSQSTCRSHSQSPRETSVH